MESSTKNIDSIEVIVSKKELREIATPEQVHRLISLSRDKRNGTAVNSKIILDNLKNKEPKKQ